MISIRKIIFSFSIMTQVALFAQGNLSDEMKDHEEKLNAETKQVNQFFRRFNGEESEQGDRYYETDKNFRSYKLRKAFLPHLFDQQMSIDGNTLKSFVDEMTDKRAPQYISLHSNNWFAEVNAEFLFKGKKTTVILFMEIQKQGQGYEWVISDVSFSPFQELFSKDTSDSKPFIHPMSHELDFMNLRKAFQSSVNPEAFTKRSFQPDYVTLFIYEMKKGNLKYQTVNNAKFHFFTLDQWYFELSKYNRSGMNSGWLISNLVKATPLQKEQIKAYIYGK